MAKLLDFPVQIKHHDCTALNGASAVEKQSASCSRSTASRATKKHDYSMREQLPEWHWFYTETSRRLDSFLQHVKEGRDLDGALQFARYVIWCRIDRLMAPHDCQGFLKVDSSLLVSKARILEQTVQDAYRTGKVAPDASLSVLEAINHKLDLLAGHVARVAEPAKGGTAATAMPDTRAA